MAVKQVTSACFTAIFFGFDPEISTCFYLLLLFYIFDHVANKTTKIQEDDQQLWWKMADWGAPFFCQFRMTEMKARMHSVVPGIAAEKVRPNCVSLVRV